MTLREVRELVNKLSVQDNIDFMQWDFEKYVNYHHPNYFFNMMEGNGKFWDDWTEERFTMFWADFVKWVHSFDQ